MSVSAGEPGAALGGRPRDPEIGGAIRRAALGLLTEVGYDRLTIGEVAKLAGVGRPTVYRRYSSKEALLAGAVAGALAEVNPEPPDSGDPAADCRLVLDNTIRALTTTPLGPAVIELVAPAARDQQLRSLLDEALGRRRDVLRVVLGRAEAAGQLLVADVETAIDLLLGAIYYRHLISRAPLTMALTAAVVATVVGPPGGGVRSAEGERSRAVAADR